MTAGSRRWWFCALLVASASASAAERIYRNSFENPVDCVATPANPECPTFTIASPVVTTAPGEVQGNCYYFRSPNTATVGLSRIESTLGGAAAYVMLFATFDQSTGLPTDRQPPGTVSNNACGIEASTNNTVARRIYQAHATREGLDMPTDDGTGQPVAIEWLPNQPMFVQIVAVNTTDQPIQSSVVIGAEAIPTGVPYTRTETYSTYNTQITVPAMTSASAVATCNVPPGVKFWHFTTHTHRFATSATLSTFPAATTLVVSTDFESPAIAEFRTPPFLTFAAGQQLRYACNYFNFGTTTVQTGADEFTDENCVGITYFFPATRALQCINNIGPL